MENKVIVPGALYYFGTSLREYGHYYWLADGNMLRYMSLDLHRVIPFNPEELPKTNRFGEYEYHQIEGYSIIAYCGSPYDKRGGCKSVFFVQGDVSEEDLMELIMNNGATSKVVTEISRRK